MAIRASQGNIYQNSCFSKKRASQVIYQKNVHLKFFWTLFKNVHCRGPCSLRPCISRPCCTRIPNSLILNFTINLIGPKITLVKKNNKHKKGLIMNSYKLLSLYISRNSCSKTFGIPTCIMQIMTKAIKQNK